MIFSPDLDTISGDPSPKDIAALGGITPITLNQARFRAWESGTTTIKPVATGREEG
jgi:hypothetical protein